MQTLEDLDRDGWHVWIICRKNERIVAGSSVSDILTRIRKPPKGRQPHHA